ncbi:hypothetical protein IVB38_06910 [Bradyrhizobium sp. 38]|uniref:hypothetical protein n=1 Tax=unclassified Bradyrhizobium TaxID=2631580 RepID=UPI001FFA2186|nr:MULTISPECIES: hypothetical protein [unclassified Bradyrhizobium]MCK1335768.1 hypothetical protein [Bradyrhizobium sp. 38]MCK1479026.1 hypothetical protein [Bradyrhizobium sp. 197]MCK1776938.1 hypothetical protein [Bradyrhizobium sp. 132]UPJ59719.1 hypothetical protein IVB24_07975 [Bradyrhizobium sp. 192]
MIAMTISSWSLTTTYSQVPRAAESRGFSFQAVARRISAALFSDSGPNVNRMGGGALYSKCCSDDPLDSSYRLDAITVAALFGLRCIGF